MDSLYTLWSLVEAQIETIDFKEWITVALGSYTLIVAAEMGDKSQLVCMTLASKHSARSVMLGAVSAFMLLNTLAVLFGAAIAHWMPEAVVAAIVAVLFAAFGLHALGAHEDNEKNDDSVKTPSRVNTFLTTFSLITLAEFGDKTQLAVVALSSGSSPAAVWLGSTAALATTSALGIIAGRTLLKRISIAMLHKISGLIFLVLAGFAAFRAYESGLLDLIHSMIESLLID